MLLLKLFEDHLKEVGPVRFGDRLLVAVSGGADSVALLFLLSELIPSWSLQLEVAHLNHGLRAESDADARFVEQLSRRLDLSFHLKSVDIPALRAQRGGSVEEVGRDERRAFLSALALERGCRCVALGHHRDDQVETVLHRLLRGTGTAGLAGMHAWSPPFFRPLLPFSREELRQYLQYLGEPYREDPSNRDCRYTRNRIRHELLPVMRKLSSGFDGRVAGLAKQLAEEEVLWSRQVDRWLDGVTGSNGAPRAAVADLRALPGVFRRRVLRELLCRARRGLRGIGRRHLELLDAQLGIEGSWRLDLPDVVAICSAGELRVSASPPEAPKLSTQSIEGEGSYPLGRGRVLVVRWIPAPQGESEGVAEFDAGKVAPPFRVRPRLPGDRLRVAGLDGRKRVKALLIDEKVPREQRDMIPLVFCGDTLLWVGGVRRSSEARPVPGNPVWRMEIREAAGE